MQIHKSEIVRDLLKQPGIIVAPGVWDAFSAKLIEHLGFKVAYASGGMISASLLGKADVGLYTMSEIVNQVRYIVNATSLPVISDADSGYGNALNVMRTVKEFELAGAAGIHIEDAELPKKRPLLSGRRVIPKTEMVDRIKAAIDARQNESFIIIARTNARTVNGLDDALERGHAYVEAGADMLFFYSPESVEELRIIGSTFKNIPVLASMGGGITPYVPHYRLEDMGYKMVIYSGEVMRIAAKAILDKMKEFRDKGDISAIQEKQLTFAEHSELLGIKEYYAHEVKYLRPQ